MGEIFYYKELNKERFQELPENLFLKLKAEGYIKEDEYKNKSFRFVGIISDGNNLTAILPKIIKDSEMKDEKKCEEYLGLIIDLLKLEQRKQSDFLLDIETDMDLNMTEENNMGMLDFFFKDYEEYGLYENEEEYYTYNGGGDINWELTIEEEDAVISRGTPIYLNLHTRIDAVEEDNYIMELHKYILEKCIKEAASSLIQKILGVLDVPNILFNVPEDRLGDVNYQVQMVEREMRTQFSERKVRLLKAMKIFLNGKNIQNNNGLKLWGTKSFYNVWENACSYVLRNEYKSDIKYKNEVEKNTIGKWNNSKGESNQMKPDIVLTKNKILYILDAKYYKAESFCQDLGVQDIAKQFMYEKALEDLKPEGGEIKNIFLVSGREDKYISSVEMGIFSGMKVDAISLDSIKILRMYKRGGKMDSEKVIELIKEGRNKNG